MKPLRQGDNVHIWDGWPYQILSIPYIRLKEENIAEERQRAHPSKQCTLGAQSYKWYGMDAQDVLIVKIPIIRKFYWPLLRY